MRGEKRFENVIDAHACRQFYIGGRSVAWVFGLTSNVVGSITGIPQSTISVIENGRVNLGVERAQVLARALKCHPAVLVFPNWDVAAGSAA